jgi:hypothetical protein
MHGMKHTWRLLLLLLIMVLLLMCLYHREASADDADVPALLQILR